MHSWYLKRYPIIVSVPTAYTATVTPPGGTIYQYIDVTFTVSTDVPTPNYTWSVASGGSVISGQGTTSAVIRFTGTGSRTVTCDVTGGGAASDSDTVTVTAFTPALISNLAGWWDASSLSYVTVDGSNKVSQVNDRSGNSRNMTQGNGLLQPTWSSSVRNGLGAVLLDNADDFIQTSVIAPTNWIGSGQNVTVLAFCSLGPGRFGLQLNTSRTGSTSAIQSDNVLTGGWRHLNSSGSQTVQIAPESGAYTLDILRWTSGQKVAVKRKVSGTATDYESASTVTHTYVSNLGAFIGSGTGNNQTGYQCESMVFSRRLTDAEVRQLTDYIEGKWGTI